MVGPCEREWKVLRETDGERFIAPKKVCCFQGHFAELRKWKALERDLSDDWEFSLCDLISSRKRVVCISKKPARRIQRNKFQQCKQWTIKNQFWGCKNFFDHYNATPSLEAMIAIVKRWSRTWFRLRLRVTRSYKFSMTPADLLRDSNQVLWAPFIQSEAAQAIHGEFPVAVGSFRQ